MNNNYYIVLFKDGSMMPLGMKPKKENHQKGARFFECSGNITLGEIGEWYGMGTPEKNKQYGTPTIKEIYI